MTDATAESARLRPYQLEAIQQARQGDTIVVLPTGSGKTRIAAEVAKACVNEDGAKALFLVPTCILVKQQAAALESDTQCRVARYRGSATVPREFDILVSTPRAFLQLTMTRPEFGYTCFGLVVIDEIHHMVGKHDYRTVARQLSGVQGRPRILGLTASMTYATDSDKIKKAVSNLCVELDMKGNCIFTASPARLVADGYHACKADCIVSQPTPHAESTASSSDDSCQMPAPYIVGKELELPVMPHDLLRSFLRLVLTHSESVHGLTYALMNAIKSIEAQVLELDAGFLSPIWGTAGGAVGGSPLSAWGEYAHSRQKGDAAPAQEHYRTLEHMYEAARLIVVTRQCGLELAMRYLVMHGVLTQRDIKRQRTAPEIMLQQQWESCRHTFVKAEHLKNIILEQHKRFSESFRCIVFVQQRVTTHVLEHFVNNDPELSFLRTGSIYAVSSRATPSLRVTASQSAERINKFETGEINVLFATSVAEEGMDIPAANCVVQFDAILTAVSMVQSRGRARQESSAFVVMQEAQKRTFSMLEEVERSQVNILSELQDKGIDTSTDVMAKRRKAQETRVAVAARYLTKFLNSSGPQKTSALNALKGFAHKVDGAVTEQFTPCISNEMQQWKAVVSLDQFGTGRICHEAEAGNKKEALQKAALGVLKQLHDKSAMPGTNDLAV